MSLLALDKWASFFRIISQHGGPIRAFLKLWKMDTLKDGKYKGTDSFGNRYYENTNYMISRSRWVEFNPLFNFEYDASQVHRRVVSTRDKRMMVSTIVYTMKMKKVTSEWYGWLHYKTDRLPSEDWAKYCLNCCPWCHCWLKPHQEILSGTPCAYYPYSTTRPSIYVWDDHFEYSRRLHQFDAECTRCLWPFNLQPNWLSIVGEYKPK